VTLASLGDFFFKNTQELKRALVKTQKVEYDILLVICCHIYYRYACRFDRMALGLYSSWFTRLSPCPKISSKVSVVAT
jgi:hypothetical protein